MERQASPAVHAISALAAGAISTTLTHPLDLVKARFQVQHVTKESSGIRYTGTLQAFRVILQTEGIAGLYRGVGPNVVGNAAAWGTYMYLYSLLKASSSSSSSSSMSTGQALLLASLAGAGSQVITNPIWVVKVRLQSQPHDAPSSHRYSSAMDCVKTMLKEEGVLSFWRGLTPALIGTSHGAVQMATYERMRQWTIVRVEQSNQHVQPYHYLGLGIASKTVASVVTFPYQLVKTRMQIRDKLFVRHAGFLETVKAVWMREGIPGFYRGVVPATIRTAPHAALMFATYEWFRSKLSNTKL